MTQMRIKNKDIYRIEVNDKGECIEFDLADIGLRTRGYEALEKYDNIQKEYIEKIKNIKDDKDLAFMEKEMFLKMREAMDTFLGEGACQKIFGDRNYYEMFEDLMKELNKKRPELKGKSHFEMLQLNGEKIDERIMSKYAKNKKNVI